MKNFGTSHHSEQVNIASQTPFNIAMHHQPSPITPSNCALLCAVSHLVELVVASLEAAEPGLGEPRGEEARQTSVSAAGGV